MKPGESHLKRALQRMSGFNRASGGAGMPQPDDQWGAWVEYRLQRLEDRQQWMTRLILGALLTQVGLQVLGMIQ